MASSLSNLNDNFAEGIHKNICKYITDKKEHEKCGVKYKDWECYHEYTNVKDDLLINKCSCFNKNDQKRCDKELNRRFINTYKWSNRDIN